MSIRKHVARKLSDLLQERRIVVWYDAGHAFAEIATKFSAPACAVIDASQSRLRARRRADEILRRLNDSNYPANEKNGNLLIYAPWGRGRTEEDRMQDPFEGFALIGASFGDHEAESFQSLARQAHPSHIAEINRLFEEGRPTLTVIEGLGEGARYPLLEEAIGTDSVIEAVARVLCHEGDSDKLESSPGARTEFVRMAQKDLGFSAATQAGSGNFLDQLGRYVLFSEFAFDLTVELPESLTGVPCAGEIHRDRVFAICDRMRGADDTREHYIQLATRSEQTLHLSQLFTESGILAVRETFPFQERLHLARLRGLVDARDLATAQKLLESHRLSVWQAVPERAMLWKLAERCVEFLFTADAWNKRASHNEHSVGDWARAYTAPDGLWRLDRLQRLVEQGAADCAEHEDVSALISVCRSKYRDVAEAAQDRFLEAVQEEGWPPEALMRQTQVFDRYVAPPLEERRRVAYFLVDSMRYEMGRDLGTALEVLGSVKVSPAATVLPTSTPVCMAALMPGADGTFQIVADGDDVAPVVSGRMLRNSADRMKFVRDRYGDRFRDVTLGELLSASPKKLKATIQSCDLLVVRTQEIDALGEGPSLYQARKFMTDVLRDLRAATERLLANGFETFVFAADHGHVVLPEVAPGDVVSQPPGEWKKTKRRCLLGASRAAGKGVVILSANKVGISGTEPELVVTTGFRVFSQGEGYFHEGISMQECLVPVVSLQGRQQTHADARGMELEIRYRAGRFTSRVIGLRIWYNALLPTPSTVRVEAYSGAGSRAVRVGEAADCDARDPVTGLVTLEKGKETQVPVRIQEDFSGDSIEIRATDPASGTILHRLKLDNALME